MWGSHFLSQGFSEGSECVRETWCTSPRGVRQKLLDSEVSTEVCTSPSSRAPPGGVHGVALAPGWSGTLPQLGESESPLGTEPLEKSASKGPVSLSGAPTWSGWLRASTQQEDGRQGQESPWEVQDGGGRVTPCTSIGQLPSCPRWEGPGCPGHQVVGTCQRVYENDHSSSGTVNL